MKCLSIIVDDVTLFSGEVAELQWNENAETVSITARFAPSPSLLDSLKQIAANKQQQPAAQPTVPDGTVRPTFDVVRDDGE